MITTTQIASVRTSAKNLRAAGFSAEADAYDFTADEMQAEYNEMERRRIAASHAAKNPNEPRFDIHAAAPVREGWISNTARMVDNDWTCHFCGIAQPAWAGDCLTCEQHGMWGDRD